MFFIIFILVWHLLKLSRVDCGYIVCQEKNSVTVVEENMESLKKYMYLFIESTFPFLVLKICFNVSIFFQKLLNLLKKKLRVSFKGNKKDATEFLEVYHFKKKKLFH